MDMMETVGQCDNGYACVYQNNLSWSSPTTPLPAEAHPRLVFENIFGAGGTKAERAAALRKRASLLDFVKEDMAKLKRELGASDRAKVEGYLDSVREVERRIQKAEADVDDKPLPDLDRPVGVPAAYADHARLMFDLQLLALQGDVTRVISFQLARETSNRTYPEIGVPDPHHPLTHHGNDPAKIERMSKINAFHVSLFAEFLQKLDATPEGDGSLLDGSLYMYGSGMGNPNKHDHSNLPVLVAGGGAAGVKGNRHIQFDKVTPLANAHLTLLIASACGWRSLATAMASLKSWRFRFARLWLALILAGGTVAADEALLKAVYDDRPAAVAALLEKGVDPKEGNRYGMTPLVIACANGSAKVVGSLLAAGADPNTEHPGGEAPLAIAARTGRPEVVAALLDAGAKINATDGGQSALMWAAAEGHADVVRQLLAAGAERDAKLGSGFNAWFFAAREGRAAVMDGLARLRRRREYADEDGQFEVGPIADPWHDRLDPRGGERSSGASQATSRGRSEGERSALWIHATARVDLGAQAEARGQHRRCAASGDLRFGNEFAVCRCASRAWCGRQYPARAGGKL